MSTTTAPQRYLSIKQSADLLGCSDRHVFKLISRGDLRKVKLGASSKIPESELGRFQARLAAAAGIDNVADAR